MKKTNYSAPKMEQVKMEAEQSILVVVSVAAPKFSTEGFSR